MARWEAVSGRFLVTNHNSDYYMIIPTDSMTKNPIVSLRANSSAVNSTAKPLWFGPTVEDTTASTSTAGNTGTASSCGPMGAGTSASGTMAGGTEKVLIRTRRKKHARDSGKTIDQRRGKTRGALHSCRRFGAIMTTGRDSIDYGDTQEGYWLW